MTMEASEIIWDADRDIRTWRDYMIIFRADGNADGRSARLYHITEDHGRPPHSLRMRQVAHWSGMPHGEILNRADRAIMADVQTREVWL